MNLDPKMAAAGTAALAANYLIVILIAYHVPIPPPAAAGFVGLATIAAGWFKRR